MEKLNLFNDLRIDYSSIYWDFYSEGRSYQNSSFYVVNDDVAIECDVDFQESHEKVIDFSFEYPPEVEVAETIHNVTILNVYNNDDDEQVSITQTQREQLEKRIKELIIYNLN